MDERRETGQRGEALVAAYLERRGWRVICRNWRCATGEIDLVCCDPDGVMVVCEVKARSGGGYGSPLEAITRAKVSKLRQLAAAWAKAYPERIQALRVDAFGVLWRADGTASVLHIRGIEP
ncbi:MAG: YraN family protein [Propioniciclava sp.]|uniref:YraN family protein n=1 Tax=Propioniciclava sp. TaxID=2038686 RepID=UPI0039E48059